jgi:CBS domain-containing protein
MKDEDVGSLPVVHAGQLVGVITDRDLALRVVAEQRGPETLVLEVASDRPVSVEPSANLDQALQLMAKHQVRRLPVVEDGRLVGVIAQADIARLGKDERTGALVEELSQP